MNNINIHGNIYNLKKFKHPGGINILKLCEDEQDCTGLFESYHAFSNLDKINNTLNKFKVYSEKKLPTLWTFNEDGFYNCCRQKVRKIIKNRSESKLNIDGFLTSSILLLLFIFSQYFSFFITSWQYLTLNGIISGLSLIGLGYNITHDGSHYALSIYPNVNIILSSIIGSLLFIQHRFWGMHHVIKHHQYTGNEKMDPDTRNLEPFLRKTNKRQVKNLLFNKKWIEIKLILFNIFIPGSMTGQSIMYNYFWIKNNKLWGMSKPKFNLTIHIIGEYLLSFLFFCYLFKLGFIFSFFHLISVNFGYFIGTAPNHDMYASRVNAKTKHSNDWGEMQVRHSANYCIDNIFYSKFFGGINLQIEHHLFPSLSNHQLKLISPIVKECCEKFNIPYVSTLTFFETFEQVFKTYRKTHEINN